MIKIHLTLLVILSVLFSTGFKQETNLKTMIRSAENGGNDTLQVNLLLSICDSLFRTRPFEAIEYGKKAAELAHSLRFGRGEAYAHKYMGLSHFVKGDYINAMDSYQKSLEIFESINDRKGIANILTNIGVIYNNEGNLAKALENYLRALDLSMQINDSLRMLTAYINIGLIYADKPETSDKARENYLKALKISEKLNYLIGIGTINVNLGELYLAKGDNKGALQYFEKSLDAYEKAKGGNIPYTLINIGKIYAGEKYFPNAIKYLEQALELSRQNDSKLEEGQALIALGNTYLQKGDTQQALSFFKQAERITADLGATNEHKEACSGLARTYSKRKDYLNAYNYQVQVSNLKDTLFSETSQMQLRKLQMQFEIENMLKENEVLKRDVKLQQSKNRIQMLTIGFLFLGFIVIGIFLLLIIRAYKARKKANSELIEKNTLITAQAQAITDSIVYARRIQKAVLPSEERMSEMFPEYFVLFKPRNVVSGDFYWFAKVENQLVITVADCTGHGVPGAFMSMLGMSMLKEIVTKEYITQPDVILKKLRKEIIRSLGQKGVSGEQKDGMDISLCSINTETLQLQWAGAYNPCFIARENELTRLVPNKMPIGYFEIMDKFTLHEFELRKNDVIYLSSDGYMDQFGGPENRKFMSSRFMDMLKVISNKPMPEQHDILEATIENWKNYNGFRYDQTDDITVLGIRMV